MSAAAGTVRDQVAIVGAGCSAFGERWDAAPQDLIVEAAFEAYADAGIDAPQRQIDAVFCGAVYPSRGTAEVAESLKLFKAASVLDPKVLVALSPAEVNTHIELLRGIPRFDDDALIAALKDELPRLQQHATTYVTAHTRLHVNEKCLVRRTLGGGVRTARLHPAKVVRYDAINAMYEVRYVS